MMRDVDDGTATLREMAFHQCFGLELREAYEWVLRYQRTSEKDVTRENNLHQAWDIYYQVFRRIGKMNSQFTKLELLGEGDKRNPKPFLEGANQLELVPFDRHLMGLEFASVVKISKELNY